MLHIIAEGFEERLSTITASIVVMSTDSPIEIAHGVGSRMAIDVDEGELLRAVGIKPEFIVPVVRGI